MQSQQEQVVRELSAHSMGASYVFEPLEYMKGAARREHADLVWANNSTVILMGMKAGVKSAVFKREGSLRQLRGGLRAWRDLGIPIRGTVAGCHIDLTFDASSSVILLTVEDGDDAEVVFHSLTQHTGGTPIIEASIPQTVLAELARRGGSSRDLVEYLLSTRLESPLNSVRALEVLSTQHERAWFHSKLNLVSGFYTDGAYRYFTDFVLALRRTFGSLETNRTSYQGRTNNFIGALDDAGWVGLFALLASLWSPADPGPSKLWLPRDPTLEEYQQSLINAASFLRTLPGSTFVTVSTMINAPPPAVTPWPRIREHSMQRLSFGRHSILVARVVGLISGTWQDAWSGAWAQMLAEAHPEFPPQGMISWESNMGLSALFAGQDGFRGSETQTLVVKAVSQ